MFKITFYVDDKNLGEAFKRLSGVARNVEHAYVPNVESKPNGKLRTTAGSTGELFIKEMHKHKLTEVNAFAARKIIEGLGFARSSYSYVLKGLVKDGLLKKTGTPQKTIYALKSEK